MISKSKVKASNASKFQILKARTMLLLIRARKTQKYAHKLLVMSKCFLKWIKKVQALKYKIDLHWMLKLTLITQWINKNKQSKKISSTSSVWMKTWKRRAYRTSLKMTQLKMSTEIKVQAFLAIIFFIKNDN